MVLRVVMTATPITAYAEWASPQGGRSPTRVRARGAAGAGRRRSYTMKGKVAPMSVMKRVSLIFKSKANRALDKMEDPRETLDYSYQRQLDMLTQVRRGVADVATSRKRVELQMNTLQQQQTKLEGQAKQALGSGREDLAREALSRRAALQSQYTELETQYHSLQA